MLPPLRKGKIWKGKERSGFKLGMGNLYIARTLTDDYGDEKGSESHGSDLVRSSKGSELKLVVRSV